MRLKATLALLALSCAPVLAIDCDKATGPFETAICADPAMRAQDAVLGRLYFATLKKLSGKRHELLIEDQRYWLAARTDNCAHPEGGMAGCVRQKTKDRLTQISTCYAGDTPDPAHGDVLCAVEAHSACPKSMMLVAAGLWAYPFLVTDVARQVADRERDQVDPDVCAPKSETLLGIPEQNDDQFTMTLEGAGNGWVAVKSVADSVTRGGAHPLHGEAVATYATTTGKPLPIVTLIPALETDAKAAEAFWAAAKAKVSKPCCDDDLGLDDESLLVDHRDAAGHPLPAAWSIGRDGDLTVFYPYWALARDFVASAVIKPDVFMKWVAPRYASWFAGRK